MWSHHLPSNTQDSLLLLISMNSITGQAWPNPEAWMNLSMTPPVLIANPAFLPVLPPSHHLYLYFTLTSFLVFKSSSLLTRILCMQQSHNWPPCLQSFLCICKPHQINSVSTSEGCTYEALQKSPGYLSTFQYLSSYTIPVEGFSSACMDSSLSSAYFQSTSGRNVPLLFNKCIHNLPLGLILEASMLHPPPSIFWWSASS